MRISEEERIAVLQSLGILDTPPEAIFDQVTRLAALIFKTPIAVISLVDTERQWFKSCVGLDVCETGRDVAFCDHAIRGDDVLVVLDATQDPRFCDNPLVTGEPSIRFYAGAPLLHSSGARLGTLCIIDRHPRAAFGEDQRRQLAGMAEAIVSAMAMRLDIAALVRLETERARQDSHLGQVECLAGIGHWSWEPGTATLAWSPAVYAIHGLDPRSPPPGPQEAIDYYHPEDRPRVETAVAEALERGTPYVFQARLIRKDGVLRHVKALGDPRRDESGAIAGVAGVFMDVTDVVTTDERLRANEASLQFLMENAADIILRVEPGRGVTWASPNVRRYGHEPEKLLGEAAFALVHPDDLAALREAERVRLAGHDRQPGRKRFRLRSAEGSWLWLESSVSVVRDDGGRVVEMIIALRDITIQHEVESALAASESRHRMLANNVTDIIACFDTRGRFTYLSPSVRGVLGYEPDELVGRGTATIMHPEDHARSLEAYQEQLASPGADTGFEFEYRAFKKSGEMVWLSSRSQAIFDQEGRRMGVQDVVRDVSERRQLEAELREARDEAERAAATKAQFLANMSHEIRTPLTAVLGFASLLDETPDLPEQARTYVSRVVGAGNGLLAIVNDVLDFSKLEAGQFTITPRPSDIGKVCNDTLSIFAAQALEKGIALGFEAGPLPSCLMFDPDRMGQVLINLIGNAVKFTDAGRVVLHAEWAKGRLRLEVLDTGAGMDEAAQAALFRRFSQVGGALNARHKGTGLGLAITRGLVEAMGGTVTVRSTLGQGSVFAAEIDAPEAAAEIVAASAQARPELAGVRILIVDDNEANLYLAGNMLATMGSEVTCAGGGQAALALLETNPFDLIMLDRRMPELDGPATLARLRRSDGPNACIPALLFTADPTADLDAHLDTAGYAFQGVVRKPIEPMAMFAAIADALNDYVLPEYEFDEAS